MPSVLKPKLITFLTILAITASLAYTVYAAVSDYPEPTEPWLSYLNGTGSTAESEAYYTAIAAPVTLSEWQTVYGFPGDATEALYFSEDLGVARHMRCREDGDLFACYVTYFDGDTEEEALADAIAGENIIFSTAIVYSATASTTDDPLKFYGYDSTGALTNTIPFDSEGEKYVPHSCTTCHGGQFSTDSVINGRLIPFSPRNMHFSSEAGYTRAEQEESFRIYNSYIISTSLKDVATDFVEGSYPDGVHNVGSVFDDSYIPESWDTGAFSSTLYTEIAQPYCQTCHLQVYAGPMIAPSNMSSAEDYIMGEFDMPHSEQLFKDFWDDPYAIWMVREMGWSYEVTRADDPTPNGCQANDCSLREAIIAVNIDGYGKAVTFTDTHTVFTLNQPLTFSNIDDPLLLLGNGVTETIISGAAFAEPLNFDGGTTHILRDIAVCSSSPWTAADEDDLNEALACFNQETSGTHTLTVTAEITLTGATTTVSNSSSAVLEIVGNQFTIDGNGAQRHLNVLTGNLSLSDITLTDGYASDSGSGGSIHNESGTITITTSTLSNNESELFGGGIYNEGDLTIIQSSIINNLADITDGGGSTDEGSGGGVFSDGKLTVQQSTFSGNEAYYGGGIAGDGNAGNAITIIENSTLSGNTAHGDEGGGIEAAGQVTITHSTIVSNTGLGLYQDNGKLYMANSILAFNVYTSGSSTNCEINNDPSVFSHNNMTNVNDNYCTGSFTYVDPDILLGPLQDNGGGTETHALLSGSPAIDTASSSSTSAGQRGISRPQGSGNDIGAYEWFDTDITVTLTGGDVQLDYTAGSIYELYRSDSPYDSYVQVNSSGSYSETAATSAPSYWQTRTENGATIEEIGVFPFSLTPGE